MTPWILAGAAFLAMALAGGGAMLIARRLPIDWRGEGSIENLKTSIAMVATMSSLLLGLMVNSSRYNLSEAYSDVQKYAAALQITDLDLLSYGPAACPLRLTLHTYTHELLAENWDSVTAFSANMIAEDALQTLLRFDGQIRALETVTAGQEARRNSLLAASRQLLEYRWKVTGVARTATPVNLIVVVICWFALIFAYSGLFAPANPLVIGGHILAMATIAAAIFLVTEMGEPFAGAIQVSPAPIQRLLHRMEAVPCPSAARLLEGVRPG
ncbi:DUF4239 domain-containing protein [Aquabacter spiritensis]|uniref:Uncharacterized protein DUF4239 n=1 Tax=Aquabacter spiritensis TaxID=933073 RepID=A0A4R3LRP6_9HYPH|nr:DUF4239 domain-containing protein [Aquabacter spiritensis]TCT02981.1 uncharacterized protein DUF4239 [Aquabacter spiritensis]